MIHLSHGIAITFYLLAAVLLGLSFARGDRRLPGLAAVSTAVGITAHLGAFVAYWHEWGELPLVGLGPSLSVLALLIAIGSLGVAALGSTGPLGLVLVPLVAAISGVALLVGVRPSGEPLDFRGPWFVLHVTLAMVGYAGLAVAFASGLMYLLQFRELKNKHFGAIFRFFPPLGTLDRLGTWALVTGLTVLSMALAVGWAWTERFDRPLAVENPKIVWGVLSWILIAGALLVRAGRGRRGYRGALASVVAFALVVVSYVLLRALGSHQGSFL